MALILITYDLKEEPKNIHIKVKKTMLDIYGYSDKSPKKNYQLPNTCLLKDGISPKQAIKDLEEVVTKHKGEIERYISCKCEVFKMKDLT